MNDVLYAGGGSPATGTGGGDIDVSGLLKTDASNLAPAGRETIAGIAVASVSLDNLADKDLSNLSSTKFRLLLWIFCRTKVCTRLWAAYFLRRIQSLRSAAR